jgi:hypothetical protein
MEPVSLRAYARHRGVSLRAVQKAIQAGRIEKSPGGKIDVQIADTQWDTRTAPRPLIARQSGPLQNPQKQKAVPADGQSREPPEPNRIPTDPRIDLPRGTCLGQAAPTTPGRAPSERIIWLA